VLVPRWSGEEVRTECEERGKGGEVRERNLHVVKGKKVTVGFLYSAAYAMTGPARCTISEVAVDWQEPMVLQRKLQPSNCTR